MEYQNYIENALREAQELAETPRKGPVMLVNQRILQPRKKNRHTGLMRAESMRIVGYGAAILPMQRKAVPFKNLVTTAGDQYYVRKAIASIAPANATAPTAATGMKLGTGSTAAAKSGTGSLLVTYLTGSNVLFDSTYPQASAVAGTDTGWLAIYQCTWPAGVATSATINEVVQVNDASTNATSTALNTYARSVFATTVDKASNEPLIVIWNHKFLGA